MKNEKINFSFQTSMLQPVYYNMFFCYRINQHIMPGNESPSEAGVFAAFKSDMRLFQEKP